MRYGSVCSGIEAATVAWHPLGWEPAWFAEIEKFPSAVLAHHYPHVANLGDMTTIAERVLSGEIEAPDVLCGGTPCQAFSVAGLRKGLDDDRGQLSLAFCKLANAIDAVRERRGEPPCIIVWENVPGVYSSGKGGDFASFLAAITGEEDGIEPPGKGWANAGAVFGPQRTAAWRTLDAQHFGVAQRRRRCFLVASSRGGFDPCEVLFECEGVRRDSPPSREAGQEAAGCLDASSTFCCNGHGDYSTSSTSSTIRATGADLGPGCEAIVTSSGGDIARCMHTNEGTNLDAETSTLIAFSSNMSVPDADESGLSPCVKLGGQGGNPPAIASAPVAFDTTQITSPKNYSRPKLGDPCHPIAAGAHPPAIASAAMVRRLTPIECERLQGFPDNYTRIPWRNKPADDCPDGPRYKALGNSWAAPCARWVGERIHDIIKHAQGACTNE